MKKGVRNLLITVVGIITVVPLMSSGCGDEGNYNVGYHYVRIPGFEQADYISMLKSPNEEMQYNAICNLEIEGYQGVLGTDSLKGTGRYDTALMVYQKIFPLMESKNSWVSSAAIRFINRFQYNRTAFVQSVLKNNNASKNVQLEIISDISEDSVKDQRLLNQKINFLRQQSSWLLKNGRYLLIGKKDNVSLTQLMNDYNTSSEEYKKLLILEVLTEHVTDSVFSFLTKEWATTKNERIKNTIFSCLPEATNQPLMLQWFNEHYYLLEKNMTGIMSRLIDEVSGENYSRLIVMALQKGWKPSSLLMEKDEGESPGEPLLYVYMLLRKYENLETDSVKLRQTPADKVIEDALIRDPLLRNEWLNFEKRMLQKQQPALPPEAINRHRRLTEEYLRKTRSLVQQYSTDSSLYTSFMKSLNSDANIMYKEKGRKAATE